MAKVPLPYLSLRPLGNHLVQPLYFIGVETQAWGASDLSKDTQLVSSRAGNGPQAPDFGSRAPPRSSVLESDV